MSQDRALASAYEDLYPVLRSYIARLVGEAEAEDVVQEAFVKALRAEAEVGLRLRPWLYRVATNAALDRLRRASRRALTLEEETQPASPAPSLESGTIRSQMSACVRAIADRLPQRQRLALTLSEEEGLTDAEMAAVLGTSVSGAKALLHRGRARLRQELEGSCRISADPSNSVTCDPVVPLARILRR